ncbi:hypothetical protein [Streptomyces microflavus]|uniref:hypothetical protein n=1 Tax=Streptomyces microflavus TaxID=1919 RepID=UPI002E374D97|nr:hypothetical protein [Streptomyces microflavus]
MQRLAFIRLLVQQGVDQAQFPAPLSAGSILTFHDAVEFFLILTSEHLGISVPERGKFTARFYDSLHPDKAGPVGVDLAGRIGIQRLTEQRNAFKHTAAMPTAEAVKQANIDTVQFFEDNTPRVFQTAFSDIDMVDLIPQPNTRVKLQQSAEQETAGERIEAMAWLVEAFDELLSTASSPSSFRSTPFSFGPNIHHPLAKRDVAKILRQPRDQDRRMPLRGASSLADEYVALRESVVSLQRGARLTALGIDYSEYWRFNSLTPGVHRPNQHSPAQISAAPEYSPDAEEYAYCQRFVIASALRIAEAMAHRRPPSWEA